MDSTALATGIAAAPVIVALVAAIGGAAPRIPRTAYPLLAVALGVAWNCAVLSARDAMTWEAPLVGIVVGLAASGLYSGIVKPGAAAIERAS